MEKIAPQTENIASFNTSTSKRSVIAGKLDSDESNSDEEYATSGFYVREKSNDKTIDCSTSNTLDKTETLKLKENGISSDGTSDGPIKNGDNAEKDGHTENEQLEDREPDLKGMEYESKNEGHKIDENVTSSSEPNHINISNNIDEENGISSTSSNVEMVASPDTPQIEPERNKLDNEGQSASKDLQKTDPKSDDSDSENKEDIQPTTEAIKEASEEEVNNESSKTQEEKSNNEDNDNEKKLINESVEDIKIVDAGNGKKEPSEEPSIIKKQIEIGGSQSDKEKPCKEPDLEKVIEIIEENTDNEEESAKEQVMEKKKETLKHKKGNKTNSSEPSISGLQKHKSDSAESQDMDMDEEDFDPSMFCPDITMDVDDAPVVHSDDARETANSPLPYEPIFSTLVDEITGAELQFDLTPVEIEMRKQMFTEDNPVQKTKVHCTACNVHLGSALSGANNRFVHPLLKVLICKNCYHFYTSGEFQKDEDGSELYCRWCGQGGHVLCCSSCEYVFCKRCIKNNFGLKKFKEIRESDDWNCFRCEPEQLSILRAACAEFMEYYTRELSRASSLAESHPEVMTTDYTTCCLSPEPKKDESKTPAVNRNRRKRSDYEVDPDYTPIKDDDQPPSKKLSPTPPITTTPVPLLRPIAPKSNIVRSLTPGLVRPQISSTGNQVFRITQPANARFSTPTSYTLQKTTAQGTNIKSPAFITVPSSKASTGYIQIVPTSTRMVRPLGSISTTNSTKPTGASPLRTQLQQRDLQMKHEWFEKTVRAAARVNSNLSYTLTQLNRQQSQASSVEALAMVHNKLQEVLSTSINSLIQIRKNLRTEFIAGIKNVKFPPKPVPPLAAKPIVVKDDDDVIFVNTTNSGPSKTQPPPLIISKTVSLTKINSSNSVTNPFAHPKPSTSGTKATSIVNKIVTPTTKTASVATVSSATPVKGGGFLKVRSFVSLQSVPSECITIPDDPTSPISEKEDPLKVPDDPLEINNDISTESGKRRTFKKQKPSSKASNLRTNSPVLILDDTEPLVYNVTQKPSREIKKMMEATVVIQKSLEIEKLLKNEKNLKN
ncbi:uncharacterized protein LOC126738929 isoform X2 [Anthonomus grandis grandis]|uniref:uncharacterized protein LOC126738929 isoform X2 n=1 Tax=Anthonomus grandis grandis TaxID=2921223 RepID=UPI0021652558|nr:uncharacterized protein LOC126738929 isoform X2 [Anthonomus grandis grandis]